MCAAATIWIRPGRCRRCARPTTHVVVDTSDMTESEVVAHLLDLVHQHSGATR